MGGSSVTGKARAMRECFVKVLDELYSGRGPEATAVEKAQREDGLLDADTGEVLRDDPDDPMRVAMRQVQGVFAELDRATVVKRMRDGRKAKAATGRKATGSYAFGTESIGEGRDRDAGPRADERPAVAEIVRRRRAGESHRAIAAALDEAGIRPRRAASWSAMSVRNIAEREGVVS